MRLLIYITILLFAACTTVIPITESITIPAEFPIKDSTKTFVLIDAADVSTTGIALVKRREQVVTDVKKEFVDRLPFAIKSHLPLKVIVDTTLNEESKLKLLSGDSSMKADLMQKHNAEVIAVLKNCFGGFEQDQVVTEKKEDGSKSKTAYYSVVFQSTWQVIYKNRDVEKQVTAKQPHSTRSVASGLLARGPAFKANKDDLVNISSQNAIDFTGLFRDRQTERLTFTKKKK